MIEIAQILFARGPFHRGMVGKRFVITLQMTTLAAGVGCALGKEASTKAGESEKAEIVAAQATPVEAKEEAPPPPKAAAPQDELMLDMEPPPARKQRRPKRKSSLRSAPATRGPAGTGAVALLPSEPVTTSAPGGDFKGRDARINDVTYTAEDALSTFAIDVDTAAYSIARRTLNSNRMPTPSLVRVEEAINYFRYDYEPPRRDDELFSIQADGAKSPVDGEKHLLRVGIQSKIVENSERLPANIVFLVDTSCSMTSQDKLPLAKKALEVAVNQLGENDRVAISTYAGNVRLVLPPTNASNKRIIRRAIRGLFNGGGTAMSDGMTVAYKQAAAMLRDGAVTRVIVLSDGDANIGATTHEQILRRIEGYVKEGVFLTTVGFGDGNYKDAMMEQLANKGNGNYYYIDSERMAERVFARDFTKILQDVAQDVKIQVDFDADAVASYRLVGYENRDVADADFRNDKVDAGEIGAGHQVTALYELTLTGRPSERLATVRVRAKRPRGTIAKEVALPVPTNVVTRAFTKAPEDFRFATAVMGGAELLRNSPHAKGWTYARVISIASDTRPYDDPDRAEFVSLMKKAAWLSGENRAVGMR